MEKRRGIARLVLLTTAAGEVSDAECSRQCHDDLRLAAKAA